MAFALVTLFFHLGRLGIILALICISVAILACHSLTFRPDVFCTRGRLLILAEYHICNSRKCGMLGAGGLHALLCRDGVMFRRRVAARGLI